MKDREIYSILVHELVHMELQYILMKLIFIFTKVMILILKKMLMNENIMERIGENYHFFRMIMQYYFIIMI